jgi:uncharacterized membrane protein YedE/YeeE
MLEGLYLRAYAKNLARSYRNDPANAASDAQIQISTMILIVTFMLFIILGSLFFPAFLGRFLSGGDWMYGSLIGVTLVVVFGVNSRFGRYERTPELAQPYATTQSRRWSLIVFWGVMVGFLAVVWTMLGNRRPHL